MKLTLVYTRACHGISAPLVTVETHLSFGKPQFNIVGLPETAVKESKDRVRSAIMNSGFEFPRRRITVNLAPADLPKEGARFDLSIALGILSASGQIPIDKLTHTEFTGELALSGELRPIRGILPMLLAVQGAERQFVIPAQNKEQAELIKNDAVYTANHLLDVCAYLKGEKILNSCNREIISLAENMKCDLAEVKGQAHAKRALEIAAAGKHSLLMIGPPGTGKTLLANRLPSILPLLTEEQAMEVAAIFSVSSNGFDAKEWRRVPFRSPHHSSSNIALVGGGRPPRPGEISLAHHGILFLDELPEFDRKVLESLREPLESGQVTISRAAYQTVYPARFQLVSAMNPCPCGYAGNPYRDCHCTSEQINRYLHKLSGPLLDRMDLQIEVPALSPEVLSTMHSNKEEKSETVKERVLEVHQLQWQRQQIFNAQLSVKELEKVCPLEAKSEQLLNLAMKKFNFSARVYHRVLKVARTIADLAGSAAIQERHISEALAYRCLDKFKANQF